MEQRWLGSVLAVAAADQQAAHTVPAELRPELARDMASDLPLGTLGSLAGSALGMARKSVADTAAEGEPQAAGILLLAGAYLSSAHHGSSEPGLVGRRRSLL